jgi:uncharacterized membrane protein
MNKTRLEAFSDGVLAIIITIMVLELKTPHEPTIKALLSLWDIFVSYIISFIFIAIYWGNHHHLMHTVHHVNSKIIWANMGLLFTLSLVPFTTAFLGENHFESIPMAAYSVNLIICAVSYFILQKTIMAHYTHSTMLIEALKKQEKKGMLSMMIYITCLIMSFFSIIITAILILAVTILWVIPDKNIERALKEEMGDRK